MCSITFIINKTSIFILNFQEKIYVVFLKIDTYFTRPITINNITKHLFTDLALSTHRQQFREQKDLPSSDVCESLMS